MRYVGLGAALLGGICLVATLFVRTDALGWAGLGLLGVATAATGARLARVAALRVVCAAGSVALAWSVLETAHAVGPDREVDALAGGVATLCVAVAVLRGNAR